VCAKTTASGMRVASKMTTKPMTMSIIPSSPWALAEVVAAVVRAAADACGCPVRLGRTDGNQRCVPRIASWAFRSSGNLEFDRTCAAPHTGGERSSVSQSPEGR